MPCISMNFNRIECDVIGCDVNLVTIHYLCLRLGLKSSVFLGNRFCCPALCNVKISHPTNLGHLKDMLPNSFET